MKVLWAPWRMGYILSDQKEEGCIFCLGKDRKKDEERLILYAGSLTMAMMNRFPYNNGHVLVAPVKHASSFEYLNDEEALDLMRLVQKSIQVLKEVMNPEGFNVGVNIGRVAGAGLEEHMHFHIVPRWNGDTNFMTVLGDVRVIPEHIKETYSKLLPFFNNQDRAPGGEK